jgi:hypothetical protein
MAPGFKSKGLKETLGYHGGGALLAPSSLALAGTAAVKAAKFARIPKAEAVGKLMGAAEEEAGVLLKPVKTVTPAKQAEFLRKADRLKTDKIMPQTLKTKIDQVDQIAKTTKSDINKAFAYRLKDKLKAAYNERLPRRGALSPKYKEALNKEETLNTLKSRAKKALKYGAYTVGGGALYGGIRSALSK